MNTDIIIVWTLSIVSIAIGYLFGYFSGSGKTLKQVKRELDRQLDNSPVGVVLKPTQQDIEEDKNPIIKAGKQQFKKLLDTLNIK